MPPGPPTARRSPTRRGTASPARGTSGSRMWMARAGSTSRLRARHPRIARACRRTARRSPTKKDTGAGTDVIIAQRPATGGTEVPVTNTVQASAGAGTFYPRPTWSHDSTQIFYARNVGGANLHDIYRSAAAGGDLAGTGVVTGNHCDDYHPAVSPDGTKLCFTQQGANKDIFTVDHRGRLPRGAGFRQRRRVRVRMVAGHDEDRVRPRSTGRRRDSHAELPGRGDHHNGDRRGRHLRRERRVGRQRPADLHGQLRDRGVQRLRLDSPQLRGRRAAR